MGIVKRIALFSRIRIVMICFSYLDVNKIDSCIVFIWGQDSVDSGIYVIVHTNVNDKCSVLYCSFSG